MAQIVVKDVDYPPSYSTRFVSFGSTITLHGAGGSAPAANLNLPCQVFIEHDAGQVFAYKDGDTTTKSITFKVTGNTGIRMAPSTIETTTTVTAVTVWWTQVA